MAAAQGVYREYVARLDMLTRVKVLDRLACTSGDAALRDELAATISDVLTANPVSDRDRMRTHSPRIRAALALPEAPDLTGSSRTAPDDC